MEHLKGTAGCDFVEPGFGSKWDSMQSLLDAQRELVHQQIEELQKIVVLQCRLTGINPLSQEMAAGALSIKIGRRPRDLLTPKAIKCLQGVFAIKDTITKREAREISAFCGATITQVREFFSGQRSRVRRFLRQSHDKNDNMQMGNTAQDDDPSNTKQSGSATSVLHSQAGVVNWAATRDSSWLSNDDTLGERELFDSNFIKIFFFLMRKESTFSGQVQLLERILQIHDSTVLCWFVTKGGIPILAKWLGQASAEEQTTVLNIIFKVLCHLPLHKALPVQMSTILQIVNKLRFYRTSDISNRARILLARWSKMFVRSQSGRKAISPSSAVNAQRGGLQGQQEFPAKRRAVDLSAQATDTINNRIKTGSAESSQEYTKKTLALTLPSVDSPRQPRVFQSSAHTLSSCDVSKKRPAYSIPLDQTKERRKVLMVEEPKRISCRRKSAARRSTCKNSSRPLSTDDIQKAKRRTRLLQSMYSKVDVLKLDHHHHLEQTKTPELGSCFTPLGGLENLGCSKDSSQAADTLDLPSHGSQDMAEAVNDSIPIKDNLVEEAGKDITAHNSSWSKIEQLKETQILWMTPQEMKVDPVWRVATGEESKEVEFQSERVKREKEAVYLNEESIPSDPKEPWDIELDYDDSLTPEIPLEPIVTEDSPKVILAGADEMEHCRESRNGMNLGECSASFPYYVGLDGKACSGVHNPIDAGEASPCTDSDSNSTTKSMKHVTSNGDSGPDLELLAVLLKNPDLVFALTSDQGASLSKAETMALLDLLKMSSAKQENLGGGINFGSNKQKGTSSMIFDNLEVLKIEPLKDGVSSLQLTPVTQSVQRLAEPISTAVVPSINVSQSSHLAPTNAFYGGGYVESKEDREVSDSGLREKRDFSLYTNDCLSRFLTVSLDNHRVLAQEPQERSYESENGSPQQGTVRTQQEAVKPLSLGFPTAHTALTSNKDLRPKFVRTSGPSQPPSWPVVTGQQQLKVVNAKNHGVGLSTIQSVPVDHGFQATNRPMSGDMPVARFAPKQSLPNGTNQPLPDVIATAQSLPQQNTSQGRNRSLAISLLNGQSYVKNSHMQHGNMRIPNTPVASLSTTNRMQTSHSNTGFTQGSSSEMHDHCSSSSSGLVPSGTFKGKGTSNSFDRVRSLVMDFGKDTGRDHAKNNYLPPSQGHGPRPDTLPLPPSYPNKMLPPVQPNFVRAEPVDWVCPKAAAGNYSQGHVSMIEIVPPRNPWRSDIRGNHPPLVFHQVHDPFPRMPHSDPSKHPGNFWPRNPWAWTGRGGSSRPGRR